MNAAPRWLLPPRADAVALAALVLALPGLWLAPTMFFACWLAAWWYWMGVALGALVNAWIHALTGGRWGLALGLFARPLARRVPWLVIAGLPLAAGLARVFPWAGTGDWTQGIDLPDFQRIWYTPVFFWTRMALLALTWWTVSRPAVFARKGRVAGAILLWLVTGTLATVDLVDSLVPGWISTGSGLVVLAGGVLGGAALATLAAAGLAPGAFPTSPPRPAIKSDPPVWRDLGNLLLAWTMVWAYLAFMEFLIVWAEDLPRETSWFLPRLEGGWAVVGVALAAGQFALPFLLLLWRRIKDAPRRLARIAAGLALGQLLNTAWLVLPSVAPHDPRGWWLLPLLAIAIGLPAVARAVRDAASHPEPGPARAEVAHA